MTTNVNWQKLTENLKGTLTESLASLVDGAQADIQAYALAISENMVAAAQTKDADLLDELNAQVEMLAEIHRIKANNEAWSIVHQVVRVAAGVLIGAVMNVEVA